MVIIFQHISNFWILSWNMYNYRCYYSSYALNLHFILHFSSGFIRNVCLVIGIFLERWNSSVIFPWNKNKRKNVMTRRALHPKSLPLWTASISEFKCCFMSLKIKIHPYGCISSSMNIFEFILVYSYILTKMNLFSFQNVSLLFTDFPFFSSLINIKHVFW